MRRRHSRAILELRLGQADLAEKDLSALLEMGFRLKHPGEILAARRWPGSWPGGTPRPSRTRARHDASTPARRTNGSGSAALLAARRFDTLQFDSPEAIALLPMGEGPCTPTSASRPTAWRAWPPGRMRPLIGPR